MNLEIIAILMYIGKKHHTNKLNGVIIKHNYDTWTS